MSSPLLVNTHLNRLHGRWQPSINTSTIREEDGLNRHSTVYEQDDKSGSNDEDEEDDENVALGHLGQHRAGLHNNTNDNQSDDDEDEMDNEEEEEDDEEEDDEDALAADDDDSSTFTSSPSIPDENIDFDLVYTLHTFEATVEGQASVLKGDSLTLLDDSNSYWWLVKVLKSNEVGYIPAENIETPFERLARLNKHRNVEVTAIQQATHYINTDSESSTMTKATPGITKLRKNVSMSKDIYYQSHIILLGDDDEELEETYEEWEDDMVDEDSQSTMLASEDDQGTGEHGLDISDTEMDHDEGENEEMLHTRTKITDEKVQGLCVKTPNAATSDTTQHTNETASTAAVDQPKKTTLPTSPSTNTTSSPNSTTTSLTTSNSGIHSAQPISSSSSPKDGRDNKKNGGSFLRLFTRGKRYDGKKGAGAQTNLIDNTSSSDQGSTNSSTISEETGGQQKDSTSSTTASTVPVSSSTSSMSALDPSAKVLRVYAGNINVNATYNSVLVYDHTNAEALLRQALDRFHISQIEGKARGKRSSMTSSPSQYPHQQNSSGVEYYLSVKPIDGDELTLLPQDKPLMIYQSLTAHLTTPMPSLSNLKQQITNVEFGRIGSPTNNKKRTGTKFGEDSIRFYLHKRIKRVNEQDGQLYVKVSLYHDDAKRDRKNSDAKDGKRRSASNNSVGVSSSSLNNNNNNNNNNSNNNSNNSNNNNNTTTPKTSNSSSNGGGPYSSLSPGSFSMRRKKSASSPGSSATSPKATKTNTSTTSSPTNTQSQIDKLIAVSPVATVADLIDIALEKFHLLQQPRLDTHSAPRYRMLIVVNSQGPEKHLNPNSKLVEVLHDDTHAKNTTEKRFVLRKVTTVSSRSGHNISSSSGKDTRSVQQHNANKPVTPDVKLRQQQQQQQKRGEELDAVRSNTTTSPLLTPIPVMQLDTDVEMVLRRLERALMTYNRKSATIDSVAPRLQLDPQQPKLAVMRNVNQGVDVYLPHGILRSKPLPPQQTQYVLMANDKKKDSAWDLVTQRVLASSPPPSDCKSAPPATTLSSSPELVADSDLKALIKFATQFLESKEKAGTGSSVANDAMGNLANKDGGLQPSSSLSSLDELERELQRIMASHTIS